LYSRKKNFGKCIPNFFNKDKKGILGVKKKHGGWEGKFSNLKCEHKAH
jgi:hypothetical protein